MVFSVGAVSDFGIGAQVSVVSLAATPRTRRYCFMACFHCMSISKTCLVAHCYSVFACFFFSGISMNLGGFFFFESQWEWSRSNVFGFYPSCVLHV